MLIIFRGVDETYSQQIHARTSYKGDEIVWGGKFAPMRTPDAINGFILHLDKLDNFDYVPLPEEVLVAPRDN
jgi:inward rectifier potassium channel